MKKRNQLVAMTLVLIIALPFSACGKSDTVRTESVEAVSTTESTAVTEPEDVVEENDDQKASTESEVDSILSEEGESTIPEETSEQDDTDSLPEDDNTELVAEENDAATESLASAEYENEEDVADDGLTPTMRNSINMLNYMTSLTQQVNVEKGNQLFLETAYNSFDNLFPNSVDTKTQAQITSLMDTIQNYRMITVKRDRLEYIYEQNRAQAMRKAIPNPVGLLSAVQSGSALKVAASVLYMAVDAASSYQAATSQADLQFIKDGWELDDAESAELHNSTKNALTYMLTMVRDYDIPGDYALNRGAVEDFVSWSSKSDSELERKISWFETNNKTYSAFGPYWLELAKDYYNYGNYEKCLESVKHYESIATRIFRKDSDYANVLPMAIISARETMSDSNYVTMAANYCKLIHDNTEDEDWTLRYFAAQIYMNLYAITQDSGYLDEAYKIARENVVVLVDEQKELNSTYLANVQEVKASKDATKREKEEIKKYNKTIKKERERALPPVSEALYLNSDLLFALAKERNIDNSEKKKIEAILHVNGGSIFLTQALDDRFWFNKTSGTIAPESIDVSFEGDKFIIPASFVTDRSKIKITVSGSGRNTTFDEWMVSNVKRPKKYTDCSEFTVTFTNEDAEKYKYKAGETVTIAVTPVAESPEKHIDFTFNVVQAKKMVVLNGVKFERAKK